MVLVCALFVQALRGSGDDQASSASEEPHSISADWLDMMADRYERCDMYEDARSRR